MTWNTELYIYGNKGKNGKLMADISDADFSSIKSRVNSFLTTKENAIVILNEWPYKCNLTDEYHEFFSDFYKKYSDDSGNDYRMYFNVNTNVKNQIKMTVVIAKKDIIDEVKGSLNSNIYITFGIKGTDLIVLGAHPHDAVELYDSLVWLGKKKQPMPDIIVGDLNSGDYTKGNETVQFKKNREHYRKVLKELGYEDVCKGEMTRRYIFDNGYHYYTPIDHILVRKDTAYKYRYSDVMVSQDYSLSDHCPITFDIIVE